VIKDADFESARVSLRPDVAMRIPRQGVAWGFTFATSAGKTDQMVWFAVLGAIPRSKPPDVFRLNGQGIPAYEYG